MFSLVLSIKSLHFDTFVILISTLICFSSKSILILEYEDICTGKENMIYDFEIVNGKALVNTCTTFCCLSISIFGT